MRRIFHIALILVAAGCSESPITEVGNPTAAPAKATTATLETGLESVFGTFAGGAGGFTCVFDEATFNSLRWILLSPCSGLP